MPLLWDIFCRVIDNHGDLGVCWRLARELATRFHDAASAETAIAGWHAAVTGQGDTSLLPLQDIVVPAEGIRIAALLTARSLSLRLASELEGVIPAAVKVEGAACSSVVQSATSVRTGVLLAMLKASLVTAGRPRVDATSV